MSTIFCFMNNNIHNNILLLLMIIVTTTRTRVIVTIISEDPLFLQVELERIVVSAELILSMTSIFQLVLLTSEGNSRLKFPRAIRDGALEKYRQK